MKKSSRLFLGFLLAAITNHVTAQNDSLIAPGATLQLVSKQFGFTEGPSPDKKGNIFFTDQPNDKIWKYDTDGKLSVFLDKSGRANGTYFDKKGNLITCAEEKNEIWSINKKGKVKILLKDFNGKRLNGPNDLWVDKKGGIYLTDPYFQRSFWDRKSPDLKGQNVYYLPKGKTQPVVVIDDFSQPNGVVGTPDGKNLYVSDMRGRKTYRYAFNTDGSLIDKHLVIEQGSDGMALDERGNIYLAGNGGITAYDKDGKKLTFIRVPSGWTANMCFGGKDRKTLFITASESVYTIRMNVKGVE